MGSGKTYWQRTNTRIARRRAVQGAVFGSAGLAAVALLGCSGEQKPAAGPGAQEVKQPKRGGTITYAGGLVGSWDIRGTTLDPHVNSPLGSAGFRLFYQGLLGYDPRTYEVQPEIGQRWQQPSQTEYIFTIQPDVKWHNKPPANGRLLTAEDVAFSLNRVRTPEPRFQSASLFSSVDKVEATDKSTVRITTTTPDAPLLIKLAGDGPLMLAPEVAERAGRFTTVDAVVGTGPFVMKSLEEQVGADYVRNPEYWKPGLPYLDGFRTVNVSDEQAAYAAFLGGQVDIARLAGTEVPAYVARRGAGYTPDWAKNGDLVAMPNIRTKPFDDPRVTRALRLFVDHQEWQSAWGDVWFGGGRNGSIFSAALDVWDLPSEAYAGHLEWRQPKEAAAREALSLLSAAGFNQGNPLKFELAGTSGTFTTAGNQLLQAQWKRLSQGVVDATLKEYDLAQSLQVQASRSFTYGYWGISAGGDIDPDPWLAQIYRTGGSRNLTNMSDARLDTMIDRQRTLFDVAQRKEAIREIILYMIEAGPSTIPFNRFYLNAVKPNIQGYVPEFHLKGRQYEQVWLDA